MAGMTHNPSHHNGNFLTNKPCKSVQKTEIT